MKIKKLTFIIFLTFLSGLFGAVQKTFTIHSESMNRNVPCLIVLPDEYDKVENQYAVIYLLHGYSGNYKNWSENSDLGNYADMYNMIIVCPDGGYNSWYLDSPMDLNSQYKTYVGKEVVHFIDQNYRTIAHRKSRAITGLSMGGHGALYLALEFPDIFGAAGSMSGVVDLKFTTKKYELGEKIGSFEQFPERWAEFSVISNVQKFKESGTQLIIDCGIDDVFIESNLALHKTLLDLNIPHLYIEKSGGHTWDYWVNRLDHHLIFFNQYFRKN
ncbi:MAG: esterase family protein [Candidatus Marinimicrobia bacterium]|nr:esterase family protein [Candidatus Neomarinimicrobiota bacterium]